MTFSRKGRRWLFGGALFLFINGFFVARVEEATRPELAPISALFVLVLWAPAAYALVQWLGFKRAALILLALGAFAVGIETFAVKTGWPYGSFDYTEKIGVKFFGVTPWTVPFAWSPLVLGAMALSARHKRRFGGLCVVATLFLLLFDGVLDPGTVSQNFWKYQAGRSVLRRAALQLRGLDIFRSHRRRDFLFSQRQTRRCPVNFNFERDHDTRVLDERLRLFRFVDSRDSGRVPTALHRVFRAEHGWLKA